jgi:hypothetical protein
VRLLGVKIGESGNEVMPKGAGRKKQEPTRRGGSVKGESLQEKRATRNDEKGKDSELHA